MVPKNMWPMSWSSISLASKNRFTKLLYGMPMGTFFTTTFCRIKLGRRKCVLGVVPALPRCIRISAYVRNVLQKFRRCQLKFQTPIASTVVDYSRRQTYGRRDVQSVNGLRITLRYCLALTSRSCTANRAGHNLQPGGAVVARSVRFATDVGMLPKRI